MTLPVDPRIISPLVCNPDDDLTRWPVDTLHRVAITLSFLSAVINDWPGPSSLLNSENDCCALAMQLDGMAGVLFALSEALAQQTGPDLHFQPESSQD